MNRLVLFLICALGAMLGQLANADDVLPLTKTESLPADVRGQMPHGAKSLRFGSSQLDGNNAPVLLHLYSLKGTRYLDLFQRGKWGKGGSAREKLIRLNSIRLDAEQNVNPTSGVFSALWLDPKERQMPIIKIVANGKSGFGGLWFLYIFPQGLKGKVIKQTFDFTFGINGSIRSLEFGDTDDQDLVIIRQTDGIRTTTDITPEQILENQKQGKTMIFHWNVNEFVVKDDPSIVQVKASVGIGSSAMPVILLSRTLEKDTTSNLFRLSWSFMIAGDGASSTALYDRRKQTLKFHSIRQPVMRSAYNTNYLYSKVTDEIIKQLAEKYHSDDETITATSFIENLTEFGCQSQNLGVSK